MPTPLYFIIFENELLQMRQNIVIFANNMNENYVT